MAKLQKLEAEVAALPPKELQKFRLWFDSFDAERWDEQLAADSREGKLDALVAEALADYEAGKCKPL